MGIVLAFAIVCVCRREKLNFSALHFVCARTFGQRKIHSRRSAFCFGTFLHHLRLFIAIHFEQNYHVDKRRHQQRLELNLMYYTYIILCSTFIFLCRLPCLVRSASLCARTFAQRTVRARSVDLAVCLSPKCVCAFGRIARCHFLPCALPLGHTALSFVLRFFSFQPLRFTNAVCCRRRRATYNWEFICI